ARLHTMVAAEPPPTWVVIPAVRRSVRRASFCGEAAMADSSATLHEDAAKLRPETIDRQRAFGSIMEGPEAADWYDQRVDAAGDEELRQILAHNRDEEKEHAAMVLEWLRRRDPALSDHLRTYLFSAVPIPELAEAAEGAAPESAGDGSLGI